MSHFVSHHSSCCELLLSGVLIHVAVYPESETESPRWSLCIPYWLMTRDISQLAPPSSPYSSLEGFHILDDSSRCVVLHHTAPIARRRTPCTHQPHTTALRPTPNCQRVVALQQRALSSIAPRLTTDSIHLDAQVRLKNKVQRAHLSR